MPYEILCSLRHLTDEELEARLKSLAGRERDATAQLVAHLAELDTRDLHLRAGYGSLFAYCRDALKLSEAEAYNRIEAARAARRFPLVLVLLGSGAVSLTTVRLLAPHLTFENHRLVLDSARGKTRPEAEAIVARLAPRPDAAASLRKLPAPREGAVLAEPRPDASPGEVGPQRPLPPGRAKVRGPTAPVSRRDRGRGGRLLRAQLLRRQRAHHAVGPQRGDARTRHATRSRPSTGRCSAV